MRGRFIKVGKGDKVETMPFRSGTVELADSELNVASRMGLWNQIDLVVPSEIIT